MKKFIYIAGIILINVLLAGVIFKVNHWSGAAILLSLSLTLMVLLFFPLALITSYKQHNDKLQLHLYIIAYLTVAIQTIGMLFKIMHWPGGNIFLLIGIPLPFVLFLPFYVRYHNKTKAKSDRNFLGLIFFMIYLAIISLLLAVSPSKEIFKAFIPQIEKMVSQANTYEQRGDIYYKTFAGNPENEPILKSLEMLNASADKLYNVLEDAKKELILKADKVNKPFIHDNKIDYNSIEGLYKNNISVSFINQRGDNSNENIIESRLIDFENAIEVLSNKYELNYIMNPKNAPYSLALIRNNIYEGQFKSRFLVENISALSFMQNRVRFIEYQILTIIQK